MNRNSSTPTAALVELTEREVLVLTLVADGLSIREVASRIHLSRWTVRDELAGIRRKFGARDLAHAVAIAYRTGVLGRQPSHVDYLPGQLPDPDPFDVEKEGL